MPIATTLRRWLRALLAALQQRGSTTDATDDADQTDPTTAMTTHMIDGAHVYPQDRGTDVSEEYEQQHSAGFRGGLARHRTFLDYVETGLEFYPDWGSRTLDIGAGLVHLLHEPPVEQPIKVQDQTGSYNLDWRSGMGIAVDVPRVEGLNLETNAENHVYLNYHPPIGDGASYVINTTDAAPDGTFLKLAVVDTADEEVRPEQPYKGMTGHWAHILLEETVDDPKAAVRRGYVDGELQTLQGDLSQEIQAVEAQLFSGLWGDLENRPSVFPPEPHTHTVEEVAGAAHEADLYSDTRARDAVDGSSVSVGHADEATSATTADSATEADNADTVDGYDIQKDGSDGSGIINFTTSS